MAYGKALSTYKRINKIKQSAQKISEAQNIIGEQRAKSVSKARDLAQRRRMVDAVSGAIQTGAAVTMAETNWFDRETTEKISAGLGGVAEVGSSLVAPMSQDDFLGLSTEEYRELYEQHNPDVAGGAIEGYSLQKSLNEIRKRREFDKAKPDLEENVYGFDVEQMAPYTNEIEFQQGSGYDFSQLPKITQDRLRRIKVQRGLINDPLDIDDAPEFNLMDSFDYIKNNKPNFAS